jgi:hypothetical protein
MKILDKIKEALSFIPTGKVYAIVKPLSIKTELGCSLEFPTKKEYRVDIIFGRRVICDPEDFEGIRRLVMQEIAHELYGELKTELYELEHLLYRGDFKLQKKQMRKIYRMLEI